MTKAKSTTAKKTASKKPAAKAVAEVHPLLGRSKEAGMKIVVLDKTAGKSREGSKNSQLFGFILESKTTDAAVAKIREYMNKPWDVVRMAVARGYIKLESASGQQSGTKTADGKAAPKVEAKPKAKKAAPKTEKATEPKPRHAGRRTSDAKLVEAAVNGAANALAQQVGALLAHQAA